jgi:hypothetical protein
MKMRNLALLVDIELARLAPRYASVHVDHPPLSAYPTLALLVDRLTNPDKNKARAARIERSKILCTIIGAYQPTRDRLWAAVLVAAFRRILRAKWLYGADPDEREAIFFAALIEVVEKVDVRDRPEHLHTIVWRRAKKALVRKLEKQQAWSDVGFGEEPEETADPASWLPQPLLAAWILSCRDRERSARALDTSGRVGARNRPDIDLVIRASEWGSLKAYVEAEYASVSKAERSRVYESLKRRHRRSVVRLRELLTGMSEAWATTGVAATLSGLARGGFGEGLRAHVVAGSTRGDVTRKRLGRKDDAVTRDRDGDVTRDTLEHGACDRYACAHSECSEFDDAVHACAALAMAHEVPS